MANKWPQTACLPAYVAAAAAAVNLAPKGKNVDITHLSVSGQYARGEDVGQSIQAVFFSSSVDAGTIFSHFIPSQRFGHKGAAICGYST